MKSSKTGYIIGILLIVLGLAAGVYGGLAFSNTLKAASTLEQNAAGVPGDGTPTKVNLAAGSQGVYAEKRLNVNLTIQGPQGPVPFSRATGEQKITMGDQTIYQLGSFEVPAAGEYTITASGAPNEGLAVLPLSVASSVGKVLGGVFGGLCLSGLGIVVLIVAAVRNSRAKRVQAQPAGGPGGYPPAGFPPPGGPGGPGGYPPPGPGGPPYQG